MNEKILKNHWEGICNFSGTELQSGLSDAVDLVDLFQEVSP